MIFKKKKCCYIAYQFMKDGKSGTTSCYIRNYEKISMSWLSDVVEEIKKLNRFDEVVITFFKEVLDDN